MNCSVICALSTGIVPCLLGLENFKCDSLVFSHKLSASETDNSMEICVINHADKLYGYKMKLKRSFIWKLKWCCKKADELVL